MHVCFHEPEVEVASAPYKKVKASLSNDTFHI
jgi:hypothetical protein